MERWLSQGHAGRGLLLLGTRQRRVEGQEAWRLGKKKKKTATARGVRTRGGGSIKYFFITDTNFLKK